VSAVAACAVAVPAVATFAVAVSSVFPKVRGSATKRSMQIEIRDLCIIFQNTEFEM